jgi:hypothetical protein
MKKKTEAEHGENKKKKNTMRRVRRPSKYVTRKKVKEKTHTLEKEGKKRYVQKVRKYGR